MRFIVFKCRKCGQAICVENTDDVGRAIGKLSNSDCPNCGEEPDGNWVLEGLSRYVPEERPVEED